MGQLGPSQGEAHPAHRLGSNNIMPQCLPSLLRPDAGDDKDGPDDEGGDGNRNDPDCETPDASDRDPYSWL